MLIWKHAHVPKPSIRDPCVNHGWRNIDGKLKPSWFLDREVVPEAMVDLLNDTVADNTFTEENDIIQICFTNIMNFFPR